MAMKKVLSEVLSDVNVKWHKVTEDDSTIPVEQLLTVRIFNPNIVANETEEEVIFAEERAIALYSEDKVWRLAGPLPKYSISPLITNDGYLTENTVVSHWDIATEDQIKNYTARLDYIIPWKYLDLTCDESEEESIFKALSFTKNILKEYYALTSSFGAVDKNNDTMLKLSIALMNDLIYTINYAVEINNPNKPDIVNTSEEESSTERVRLHEPEEWTEEESSDDEEEDLTAIDKNSDFLDKMADEIDNENK